MKRTIPVVFLLAAIGISISWHQADGQGLRTEKGKAEYIRVKNDSATMYADKNYFVTQTRGAVGSEGIPAEIRTGDTVRVKDRVLNGRAQKPSATCMGEYVAWGISTHS